MGLLDGKATKIAVIQQRIIPDDKNKNIKNALELMTKAVENNAKFICLPEAFATGLSYPSIRKVSENLESSEICNLIQNFASTNSVYITFGMLEIYNNQYYDSAFLITPNGEIGGLYRRHTLLTEEAEYLTSGPPGQIINTSLGKIGLLLGYDLRFPSSSQNYFNEKVDMIVCMNNTFTLYGYPISILSQARAFDNLCYFINVNCVGLHNFVNSPYLGNSLIIDGTINDLSKSNNHIIAKATTKEDIIYGDLYFKKIFRYHKKSSTRAYNDFTKYWKINEVNM